MTLFQASPVLLSLLLGLGSPIPRTAAIDKGRALYMAECSRCHGPTGIGDGPDAVFMRNQPADLRRGDVLDSYSTAKPLPGGSSVSGRELSILGKALVRFPKARSNSAHSWISLHLHSWSVAC